MRRIIITLSLFLTTSLPALAQLDANDYLPATPEGHKTIESPGAIKVDRKNHIVEAATMQDALVKGTELSSKAVGPKKKTDGSSGFLLSTKQGGLGGVATGYGIYEVSKNIDKTRLSQRRACIVAFIEAKRELALFLRGSKENEGRTLLRSAFETLVDDDGSFKRSEESLGEDISEFVEGMIQRFEVCQIEHLPKEKAYKVTVRFNVRSRGIVSRPSSAVIEAAELKAGLQQVFNEIQFGLTLPVGGRVITTAAGETCFVGYGSALIMDDDEPAVRSKLIQDARRIASIRARDSLLGMLTGDNIIWTSKLSSKVTCPNENGQRKSQQPCAADSAVGFLRHEEQSSF